MNTPELSPTDLFEARCSHFDIVTSVAIKDPESITDNFKVFGCLVDNDCLVVPGIKCPFFKEMKWIRKLSPKEVFDPKRVNKGHEYAEGETSFDIFKSQCPISVLGSLGSLGPLGENSPTLLGKSMQNRRRALELMQQSDTEKDQKIRKSLLEEALNLIKRALQIEEAMNELQEIALVEWSLTEVLERLAGIAEILPADREQYLEEARGRIDRAAKIGKRFLGCEKFLAILAIKERLRSPSPKEDSNT